MHAPDIQPLCQEFLKSEPFASIEDAHTKINAFVVAHPDFSLLKEYADVYSEEVMLDDKLAAMREHLKSDNIDEALKIINH